VGKRRTEVGAREPPESLLRAAWGAQGNEGGPEASAEAAGGAGPEQGYSGLVPIARLIVDPTLQVRRQLNRETVCQSALERDPGPAPNRDPSFGSSR
jgi:hypothetical protein